MCVPFSVFGITVFLCQLFFKEFAGCPTCNRLNVELNQLVIEKSMGVSQGIKNSMKIASLHLVAKHGWFDDPSTQK